MSTPRELPRVLGPVAALSVVVGSVIGSGIFIVPATVAMKVGGTGPIAIAWIIGGLFSLAGALTIAELAAMLPKAGGPYVYLKRAYGPPVAFLFGWTEFLVIRAGSIATLASAFALYFGQVVPAPAGWAPDLWQAAVAIVAIAIVAIINVAGTGVGGQVQVVGTALKVGALVVMMVAPFVLGVARVENLQPFWPEATAGNLGLGIMAAMVGILWTYDGWVNASELAEEIRDPGRNIPRALGLGMAILIAVYLGMTLVYHLVLPFETIAAAETRGGSPNVVAAVFCRRLMGVAGTVAIAMVVMTSTGISLNGNALSGPRAYFAMARDGLFPRWLAAVHPRFLTPANAIVAQAVWAIGLTAAGAAMKLLPPPTESSLPGPILAGWTLAHERPLYDILYSYVIFGGTVIYTMTIASVFVLRRKLPDQPRPYRTWGYPVTPALYIAASLLLIGSMLRDVPLESIAGLGIIAAGLPFYFLTSRGATPEPHA